MKHRKQTLSVAIAVYNEEAKLEKCLMSVKRLADEIIIVDGGSSDKTVAIAKKHTPHVVKTDNPPMFHINKQKAVDKATGDWVLQLDADERVTPRLSAEIRRVINESREENGYWIPRKNYICGVWMRYGGMYPDPVTRLFRNGKGEFPCKSVHEQIEISGKTGMLHEALVHQTYRSWDEYMKNADVYTTLTAQEMIATGTGNNPVTMVKYLFIKPASRFISLYIRHKGMLDGWNGLLWALFSGMHFPMAYVKFLEMEGRGS